MGGCLLRLSSNNFGASEVYALLLQGAGNFLSITQLNYNLKCKRATAQSGAHGKQVTFAWLEPLLVLSGITSVPPLLLRRRRLLLSRLLRASCLLQCSVRLLNPKSPNGSARFQIAPNSFEERAPGTNRDKQSCYTFSPNAGGVHVHGCTQYAWAAAGSGVRSHGYFPAAKCANFGGQRAQKSWVLCRQSQRVPSATQRRNMECWPAYRCVKVAETIKHLISVTAFQNKTAHPLLPVDSWTNWNMLNIHININNTSTSVVVDTAL